MISDQVILISLFLLLPLISSYLTPYSTQHDFLSILATVLFGVPAIKFLFIDHLLEPIFTEAGVGTFLSEGGFTLMIFVLSMALTLSVYSSPSSRFYPNGVIRVYDKYSLHSRRIKSDELNSVELQSPEFVVEIHKEEKKWVKKFESEQDVLNSIHPQSNHKCWICEEEDVETYLTGMELDQTDSTYTTIPTVRNRHRNREICKSCTFNLIKNINEDDEKDISKEDLVASQI